MMEIVLALGIGALAGSGVWLILRPAHLPGDHRPVAALLCRQSLHRRHGSAADGAPPSSRTRGPAIPRNIADPLPQALVLTAIVISFATTALFLVVLLASRGLTGTDHVDGREPER